MENQITIEGKTIVSEFPDENIANETELSNFFKDEENVPLSKLAKYYLNESLNFLCGSGTSVSIGGKTINKDENPFATVIAKNGHCIPPSPEKNEHSKTTNKILTFNPVQPNIDWFNFAVFSGSHNPSHPIGLLSLNIGIF